MDKLKECPFCGGSDLQLGNFGVHCRECNAAVVNCIGTHKEAIAAWNRRAETNETNRWSTAIELLKTFSEQDLKDMKTLTEPSPFSFFKGTDRQESTGSDNSSPKECDTAIHEPGSGASTEPKEFWIEIENDWSGEVSIWRNHTEMNDKERDYSKVIKVREVKE